MKLLNACTCKLIIVKNAILFSLQKNKLIKKRTNIRLLIHDIEKKKELTKWILCQRVHRNFNLYRFFSSLC